jgi:beta-glucosidase
VRVSNTGKLAGEEVVQLYITNHDTSIKTSLKSLKGFSRISLKPGESKIVEFTLSPQDLSYINSQGESIQFDGKLEISLGGSQPDETKNTSGNVAKKSIMIL